MPRSSAPAAQGSVSRQGHCGRQRVNSPSSTIRRGSSWIRTDGWRHWRDWWRAQSARRDRCRIGSSYAHGKFLTEYPLPQSGAKTVQKNIFGLRGKRGVQRLDSSEGEFLGVDDGKGNRLGRIVGASSEAVANWAMNPQENAAVPGYTVKMVYFSQPASANGVCRSATDKQERKLDWQAGWNIEQMTVVAVGKSDFLPLDGPKETVWEKVDSVPPGRP